MSLPKIDTAAASHAARVIASNFIWRADSDEPGRRGDVAEIIARSAILAYLSAPPAEMAASITCPLCGRTSWHPDDVARRFCGACGLFWGDFVDLIERANLTAEEAERIGGPIARLFRVAPR